MSRGCIAVLLIIARPLGVSLLISNYKTSIIPILRGNCLVDTSGVHLHHLWLSNKPSSSNLEENLIGKKIACLVDVVYQCIIVLSVTLLYFLGDRVSMHPHEADWTTTDGHYGKARLKEVLNARPCINYVQHMWSFCYDRCTMAVRESRPAVRDLQLAYNQPAGCVSMHCNLRLSSSSFIVTLR